MNRTPEILAALRLEIQSVRPDELPSLVGQIEAIKAEAFIRLAAPPAAPEEDEAADRLLTVEQVVERMGEGTTPRWVRSHASQLGAVKVTGRRLRFSERKLKRLLRMRGEG